MSASKDAFYDRMIREMLAEAPHLLAKEIGEGYAAAHRPEMPTGEPEKHPHVQGTTTVRIVYRDRSLNATVRPDQIEEALEIGRRCATEVGADARAQARQHVINAMVSGRYLPARTRFWSLPSRSAPGFSCVNPSAGVILLSSLLR